MHSTIPLPATVLDWVRDQAAAGGRYPTGTSLWQATSAIWPDLTPTGPADLGIRWDITNRLIDAYQAALPTVAAGDPVHALRPGSGWNSGLVLDIDPDTAVIWVRVDHAPANGWRPGTRVHVHRIGVDIVPTAAVTTGADGAAHATEPPVNPGGHTQTDLPMGPDECAGDEVTAQLPTIPPESAGPGGEPGEVRR